MRKVLWLIVLTSMLGVVFAACAPPRRGGSSSSGSSDDDDDDTDSATPALVDVWEGQCVIALSEYGYELDVQLDITSVTNNAVVGEVESQYGQSQKCNEEFEVTGTITGDRLQLEGTFEYYESYNVQVEIDVDVDGEQMSGDCEIYYGDYIYRGELNLTPR